MNNYSSLFLYLFLFLFSITFVFSASESSIYISNSLKIAINEQTKECAAVPACTDFCFVPKDRWKIYYPSSFEPKERYETYLIEGSCLKSFFENDGCVRCYDKTYVFDAGDCYQDYDSCASTNSASYKIDGVCINVTDNPEFNCSGFIYNIGIMNFNDCFANYDSCFDFVKYYHPNASCVNVSRIHPKCKGYAYMDDDKHYASCYTYEQCAEECFFTKKKTIHDYTIETPFGKCALSDNENTLKDCCESLGLLYVDNIKYDKSILFRNALEYFTFLNIWIFPLIILFLFFALLFKFIKGKFLFFDDPLKKIFVVSLFLGIISAISFVHPNLEKYTYLIMLQELILLFTFPIAFFFSWLKDINFYFSGIFASKIFLWIVFLILVASFSTYYYLIIRGYYSFRKKILNKYGNHDTKIPQEIKP